MSGARSPSRPVLLGIDIGTQSTKGLLATVDGEVVAATTCAHPTSMPRVGRYERDAHTWRREAPADGGW